jgi:nucleoside 2-deoxyribosyltransferase
MKVYIAMPFPEKAKAELWRFRFEDTHRIEVVSRWHGSTETVDPVDPAVRAVILASNLADLETADVVFVATTHGTPRCTLVELGYALAKRKPIVWLQRGDGADANIADASPLVTLVFDPADVVETLTERLAA